MHGAFSVSEAFSRLGPLASELACVVAHPELDAQHMLKLGFRAASTAEAVMEGKQACPSDISAVLVMLSPGDPDESCAVMRTLAEDATAPVLLAVVIPGFSRQNTPSVLDGCAGRKNTITPQGSVQFDEEMRSLRRALLASGADGVVTVMPGEPLLPHRLMDTIETCEFVATKVTKLMDDRQKQSDEAAAKKVQAAFRRFLAELPGRALENLPKVDPGLEEQFVRDQCTGVAGYSFTQQLGAGAFGAVYKALDVNNGGYKAVKVLPKTAFKGAGMLISLDQEASITRYIAEHPYVVRSHEILHTHQNFYLVMDYAGEMNLHYYTKAFVQRTGANTLHPEMIMRFSRQQAAAVAHLHSTLVCHRDLKPTNWIVADGGDSVKLSDFGLAAQLNGVEHRLHTCCGSLPFCAPEVLMARKQGDYSPLASDMWCLGVGFIELLAGPFGVEKLIGWGSGRPSEDDVVLRAVMTLPDLWKEVAANMRFPYLSHLASLPSKVVRLDPSERWDAHEMAGENGLFSVQQEL